MRIISFQCMSSDTMKSLEFLATDMTLIESTLIGL